MSVSSAVATSNIKICRVAQAHTLSEQCKRLPCFAITYNSETIFPCMITEILFGNPTLYKKIISLRMKDVKSRLW
jgi:hypothetical protein